MDGKIAGVSVTIGPDKAKKLEARAKEMLELAWISRKALKEYAGLCSWVSSIVRSMRPYCRMIWAAATSHPAGRESWDKVAGPRVRWALRWIIAAVQLQLGTFSRTFPLVPPSEVCVITFDASLTGGGATLHMQEDASGKPVAYLHGTWSDQDENELGANRVNPKFQAHWEAYMLLRAVSAWNEVLKQPFKLTLRGDALGVLQGVVAGRARNPGVNLVIAEMQLRLTATAHDLSAVHWWSEHNKVCDDLSRMTDSDQPPREVAGARCDEMSRPQEWQFLGRPGIADPDAWGDCPAKVLQESESAEECPV